MDPRLDRFYAFAETQGASARVEAIESVGGPLREIDDDLLPFYARISTDPALRFAYGVRVNPGDTRSNWEPHVDVAHNLEIARVAAGCWALDRFEPRLPACAMDLATGARIPFTPTADELTAYEQRSADRRVATAYASLLIRREGGDYNARTAELMGESSDYVAAAQARLSRAALARAVRPHVGAILERGSIDVLEDLLTAGVDSFSPDQIAVGYGEWEREQGVRNELAAAAVLSLVPQRHIHDRADFLTNEQHQLAVAVGIDDLTVRDAAARLAINPAEAASQVRQTGHKLYQLGAAFDQMSETRRSHNPKQSL